MTPHHVHHWLLGEPGGPVSLARCRDCGEQRQFGNSADAVDELKGRKAWSLTTASEERRKAGVS